MKRLRRLDVRLFASYALVVGVVVGGIRGHGRGRAPRRRSTTNVRNAESGARPRPSPTPPSWTRCGASLADRARRERRRRRVRLGVRRSEDPASDPRRPGRDPAARGRPLRRTRVAAPGELELAELAADVNLLAVELETTERRRRATDLRGRARDAHTADDDPRVRRRGSRRRVRARPRSCSRPWSRRPARLERLAADLATLSRAEEHTLPLEITAEDLGELAASAATRLRPQFDDKGVTLDIGVAPPLPVAVDRERILQVITNLLGNALVYTPAGGRVVVGTEHRELRRGAHRLRHRRRHHAAGARADLRALLPGTRAAPPEWREWDRPHDRAAASPAPTMATSRPRPRARARARR